MGILQFYAYYQDKLLQVISSSCPAGEATKASVIGGNPLDKHIEQVGETVAPGLKFWLSDPHAVENWYLDEFTKPDCLYLHILGERHSVAEVLHLSVEF